MIFVVKSYKKINNKSESSLLLLFENNTQNNCSRPFSLAQNFFLFLVAVIVLLLFYARACVTVVCRERFEERNFSFQRGVWFFKFFKSRLFSACAFFWRETDQAKKEAKISMKS